MATQPLDEPPREQLVGEVLESYRLCWRTLRYIAEPCWAELDLTMSQLKALILLDLRGCMAVCRVADALAIGRPSASNLIEQLVQLGLAAGVDDAADRRRALTTLTAEGHALMARLYQGDQRSLHAWLRQLRDDDLHALCKGLRALAGVYEASQPPEHEPVFTPTRLPVDTHS